MKDFSRYRNVGKSINTDYYIAETDPDILIVVPREGTLDKPQDARENVAFQTNYARSIGKPCSLMVVMTNLLSQDAETRRIYAEMDQSLFFAVALVVDNLLSRALGSFFIGLSRPKMPTRMFDTVEKAMSWLQASRAV